ncbi:hypothetical protein [Pantoea sp. ARC607]|uniref:hypothetical protein n=1 Tax=unclassified Pantoea TaxID=2630326 RepID=UPI000DA7BB0B|nr:hypothetical protein [Pantoea sp. ARC607]PZL92426.1 hypothetical protein CKF43_15490 [Pantoea sp. ARC607]
MIYHEKQVGHIILGEATINLAFEEQEITLASLIRQLGVMAENEQSDERVAQIADARNWLKSFVEASSRDRAELNWLVETGQAPAFLKDYR